MLLVLSLQIPGVSALELRKEHHLPAHGVSLMQGKVDLAKANVTKNIAAAIRSRSAAHEAAPGLLAKATTVSRWDARLGKEDKAVLVIWATALLMGLAVCLGLGAVALLLCCIYDGSAHCLHRARFRQCQAKVQRAHEAFASKSGDLPVCPYCVEHISVKRGPNKVVFLCGHRFHVECSNKWFSEHPNQTAHCPICRDVEPQLALCKERCGLACQHAKEPACQHQPAAQQESEPKENVGEDGDANLAGRDGALAFILQSLHRCYPEIINEGCVERWLGCNTEIWLSELTCPRYNSILRKHKV